MIGQRISHYKILGKLGEVSIRLDLANGMRPNPRVGLQIPPSFGGSRKGTTR